MTSTISQARWARTQTAAAQDLTFWRATREFREPLPSYVPTARRLAVRRATLPTLVLAGVR